MDKEKRAKLYSLSSKILITIIFGIIIFNMNECYMNMDDEVYSKVFNSFGTFITWAKEFYSIWSGRIITSALSNIFLRMPLIIFKVFNTIVYIIAIISILKIIKSFIKINNKIIDSCLYAGLFLISFAINEHVIFYSVKWVTGAFNYLWPTAFMFVALIPFIKKFNNKTEDDNNKFFIWYIFADFIACFAEQSALVLLTISTIVLIYMIICKQKINILLLIHYFVILVLTIIEFSAPGNFVRFEASTLRRYPTFNMLNMGDKLLQGIILLANQLLSSDNILMMILIATIAITNLIKDKSIIIKIVSFIPVLYFVGSLICYKLGIGETILYNLPLFGKEYIYGIKIYIPVLIFMLILWLTTVLIGYSFQDAKKGIAISIIFLGSIATSLSVSFSPTIYASGTRIYFAGDLLLVLVIGILLANLFNRKLKLLDVKSIK